MKLKKYFVFTGILFIVFLIFTMVVMKVDVRPVGPQESKVGLATINQKIHHRIGIHMEWYDVTDCCGIISILIVFCFGLFGLLQIIQRKSLFKVDGDILLLGAFYLMVAGTYAFFEFYSVNYRPIIMEEGLEASYPSSHALLVVSVMLTTMIQLHHRMKNKILCIFTNTMLFSIAIIAVVGRLISGVHWFTDILGGVLLACTLVMLYYSNYKLIINKSMNVCENIQKCEESRDDSDQNND